MLKERLEAHRVTSRYLAESKKFFQGLQSDLGEVLSE